MEERKQYTEPHRCHYEKCEFCVLYEYCETCYKETCLFENCSQFCGRCQVTCHTNPDYDFEQFDLSALQLASPTTSLKFAAAWLPTIRKHRLLKELNLEAVAVKFEEIYNLKSGLMRALDLHDYFELPKKTKIILTFNIPDRILEKIWLTFQDKKFRLIIRGLKVDYICSPNFSNYFDTPRYQYWRNIWRSVIMSNELQSFGYKIIFDVSSPVPATHKYYLKLIRRSKIKSISINCQTIRLGRYKKLALERFKVLNELPKNVEFFITGFCAKKIGSIIHRLLSRHRIYFTSSSPYLKAICGTGLSGHDKVNVDQLTLLKGYFKYYEQLHQELRNDASKVSKGSS